MNSMNQRQNRLGQSQQGMVSIIVTMIIMIVITIIVIGFAQISRREQSSALDRQLSSQAFYAAESGINDAVNAIQPFIDTGTPVPDKAQCDPDPGPYSGTPGHTYTASNIIDPAAFGGSPNRIKYTCLLINTVPSDLHVTPPSGTSQVVPIITQSGLPVDTINVAWNSTNNNPSFNCASPAGTFLPDDASWVCGLAVLRLDIVPGDPLTLGSYASLQTKTTTLFLYPQSVGGVKNIPFPALSNGQIIGVKCTNATPPPSCHFDIGVAATNKYYIRVMPIYEGSSIDFCATQGIGGPCVPLAGAQATIDATGKANDVLRRIKINKDISGLNSSSQTAFPNFALQTTNSICKQYDVWPTGLIAEGSEPACFLPGP